MNGVLVNVIETVAQAVDRAASLVDQDAAASGIHRFAWFAWLRAASVPEIAGGVNEV